MSVIGKKLWNSCARHGFGYGTLTLYHSESYLLILWVKWWDKKTKLMHLRQTLITKVDICAWWISTNVKVQVTWPWYNVSMCQAQHCAVQSASYCTILHCTLYIIPQPGYFYRGNICECSPCTHVYPCDWSVVYWYCLSVQLVTSLLRLIENTGFGIMSVYHNQNQALLRTLAMLNSGAALFSARPGLGYGTLIQYSVQSKLCSAVSFRHTSIICALWTFTNVTSVKVARPCYNDTI